ncbi:ribonuclease HII [Candidatus Saccharibacteria bacterium]|nr:ribonuclease HII [Candidatus Saccharibacteria bacterium]
MSVILGVDEVGRGCWAGPLLAGAVVLGERNIVNTTIILDDSKKLTKKQRIQSNDIIKVQAVDYAIGWVWPEEVDNLGLTKAVRLAMIRAVQKITCEYDQIIIDGNYNFLSDYSSSSCLIRADEKIPSVSAASIIAKVARDEYMNKIAIKYPGYAFESHVGYGTRKHQQALQAYGITSLHRKSYKPIQKFL